MVRTWTLEGLSFHLWFVLLEMLEEEGQTLNNNQNENQISVAEFI